jgi:acid phosphatase family membrane protein YuiD
VVDINVITGILQNKVFIVAIIAWFISQVLKFIIHSVTERRLVLERLTGDGGMPSCHSACVTALAVMCGYVGGWSSPLFAATAIFAIVVMNDAIGVRRETGKQAKSIKEIAEIINEMFVGETQEIRTGKLKELVGHTPLQVFFGVLTGLTVSVVAILIFP